MPNTDTGVNAPVFHPAPEVKVTSSYPALDVLAQQVQHNMDQGWPRMHMRADYNKPMNKPLVLCAGGPSLKSQIDKVRDLWISGTDVMVCGSAHDFVVKSGIIPDFSVQLDGGIEAKKFFSHLVIGTDYLISSQCHPSMFEKLHEDEVWLWHALIGDDPDASQFGGEPAIGGGCTTTLRAISVAIMLGYHDLHMFGFDSSFEDVQNQHAYDYEEWGTNLNSFLVSVDGGRQFTSNALFLAQAQQFQEMCRNFGHLFEPHVYGDGLIAHMINVGKSKMGEAT